MASLTELVTSRMTPEVMQKLAGLAGINSTNAKRTIDALIPTQLYDLVSMGATEAGANRLLSVLQEHKGTESFSHVLLGGDAMQSQAKAGDALQSAVYGPELSRRIGSVASSLGIPQGAASSLMGMIMPTVVGILGREVRERGLNAAGLVNLLRGERETVERAMPAALMPQTDHRPELTASRVVEPQTDRRPELTASRVVEPPRQAPVPPRANLWPWLLGLLVLGALALWYFARPTVTTASLAGTQWRWARTLFRDGNERRPLNTAAYRLDFQSDGSLVVQADCNSGKGSYTGDGATVILGTLTSTQALCPGTSLSDVFLQQLQTSGTGLLKDDKLLINLKADAGTMEFVPAK
jgi:heat shock protein HslJ